MIVALIGGASLSLLLAVGSVYAAFVLRGSYMAADYSTAGALVVFVAVAVFARFLRKRQLAIVYMMLVVTSAVVTMGFAAQIVPLIAAPAYYGFDYVTKHAPGLVVTDAGAVVGLFEGIPHGGSIPWAAWRPLLSWAPLFVGVWGLMILMAWAVTGQWSANERLAYPLAQTPLSFINREPIRVSMVVGFALVFVLGCLIGARYYFPQLPLAKRTMYLPVPGFGELKGVLSPPMFGFFSLTPADTLLSLVVVNLAGFAVHSQLSRNGLEFRSGLGGFGTPKVSLAHFGSGAMVALVVGCLWRSTDIRARLTRTRTLAAGLLLAVIVVTWHIVTGFPSVGIPMFLALAGAMFLGLGRVVAETGVAAAVAPSIAPSLTVATLGPRVLGPMAPAAIGLSHIWTSDLRTTVFASTLHGYHIARRTGLPDRDATVAAVVALCIAAPVAVWVLLRCAYEHGGNNMDGWFFHNGPNTIFAWSESNESHPFASTLRRSGGLVVAFAGAALLVLVARLRNRYLWFPITPSSLAIGTTWIMDTAWLTCLLVYVVKMIALRYGGAKACDGLKRFGMGVILGQFTVNAVWLVVDHFCGSRGNRIIWM